jgi:citrate lyase subunit beta/citryl-CoA lyase
MIPRAWLFVPADSANKFNKAHASGADALILDLEDSVALGAKAMARDMARDFLRMYAKRSGSQLWVRINALDSGHAIQDLEAVIPARPDGVVLPKPDSAEDVARLDSDLSAIEARCGLPSGCTRILPIATETPRSLFELKSYSTMTLPRLIGLTWGAEDLPSAVGAETNRGIDGGYSDLCRLARALCLAGAAAAGLPAFETVYPQFKDEEGLRSYAEQGRREGFSGMLAIHPAQVQTIKQIFTPSKDALERAQRIVALFEANPGAGVLALDGKMLDAPHLKQAQRLLGKS